MIGPWLGNCVGFYNYKFFVCLIGFGFAQSLFVLIQNIPFLVELVFEWNRREEVSAIIAGVATVIALACVFATLVLGLTHIDFVKFNKTTIESRTLYSVRIRMARRARGVQVGDDYSEEEDKETEQELMVFNIGAKRNYKYPEDDSRVARRRGTICT